MMIRAALYCPAPVQLTTSALVNLLVQFQNLNPFQSNWYSLNLNPLALFVPELRSTQLDSSVEFYCKLYAPTGKVPRLWFLADWPLFVQIRPNIKIIRTSGRVQLFKAYLHLL